MIESILHLLKQKNKPDLVSFLLLFVAHNSVTMMTNNKMINNSIAPPIDAANIKCEFVSEKISAGVLNTADGVPAPLLCIVVCDRLVDSMNACAKQERELIINFMC